MNRKVISFSLALCGIAAPASAGYREDVPHCEEQASSSFSRQTATPSATSTVVSVLADIAGAALADRDPIDSLRRSGQREVRDAEREVLMQERRWEIAFDRCMRRLEWDRERSR